MAPEFSTFVGFLDWSLTHGYAADRELDRRDVDGPYSPGNCRWTTQSINLARREMDRAGAYLHHLSGRLTPELVASAEPRAKAYKLADGGGLHLYVSPTGSKSWRFAYRLDHRHQLLTIGRYPDMSLIEAREHHAIAKSRVVRGRSPCAIKRETRARADRRRRARG